MWSNSLGRRSLWLMNGEEVYTIKQQFLNRLGRVVSLTELSVMFYFYKV